jgi:hypothetical protein
MIAIGDRDQGRQFLSTLKPQKFSVLWYCLIVGAFHPANAAKSLKLGLLS